MKSNFFKTRFAAIILIAAGYVWAGSHYIPSHPTMPAYLFQCIIITALLILGIRSLTVLESEQHKSSWPVTVFSIFSVLLLLINIMNSIHRGHISTANFLGLHNSFANLVPVAFLITGNILWVISIVLSIKHEPKAIFKSQYNIL
jgi:hypothetical protein